MIEDTTNNTEQEQAQEQQQRKHKLGRKRKYATDEERIRANSEKQKAEKRRRTAFKKKLRKDGCLGQLYLLHLAETTIMPDDQVDYILNKLKDAPVVETY